MVFEAHSVISMYSTVIIQLCQGKYSFPFYGNFKKNIKCYFLSFH